MTAELWVRSSSQYSLDLDIWQRDQVILIKSINMQHSMPNLLHIHTTRERDLLPRVALSSHAVLGIPQVASGDWRMMTDLFADKPSLVAFGTDLCYEQLA